MILAKKSAFALLFTVCCLYFFSYCSKEVKDDEYTTEIKDWHKRRIDGLKRTDGWLTLAGLYWLKEGENSYGSDKSNDIIFPRGTPAYIGKFILEGGNVKSIINDGVEVYHDSTLVKEISMQSDMQENTTILTHGSFSWYVILRDGSRYGIRLKNSESQTLKDFDGIDTYPIDKKWKIEARYERYDPPKVIVIPNVTGTFAEDTSKGALVFNIENKEYRLDALGSGERFFIIFADETNGEETYGAGRFLSVDGPDSTGKTFIDFNKAYNPPCAFTKYATCPLPPKENYLKVAITAGEKKYGEGHH
jgi:uncharacterized protein (DUF1684 family)